MVTNSDLEKWNKAVEGIEAGKNNLSPEELSAFHALKKLFNSGNFESNESSVFIKTIKDALPKHGNHRLLQKVHLPVFINLCETYFKSETKTVTPPSFTPPIFEPPIIQPPTFQLPVIPKITPPEPVVEKSVFTEPAPPAPPIIAPDIPEGKTNKIATKSNKQLILILVAIALLIAGWLVYKNWDTVSKFFEPTKTPVPNDSIANPLVGKWKGILNNDSTTLEFLSIDTVGNVKAQIYFSENRPDTLKLSGIKDGYLIDLKNETGKFSGVLQQDSSIYSGTFYDKNIGAESIFNFRNPKMLVDTLPEKITQSDTTLVAKTEKDSVVALATQVSEKPAVSNTTAKTVSHPDNSVKKTHIQTSAPTAEQLNDLLTKITNSDNDAIDGIRNLLGNSVRVEGATNISNVQQLITDVSNGNHYKVIGIDKDANNKVVSIRVSK